MFWTLPPNTAIDVDYAVTFCILFFQLCSHLNSIYIYLWKFRTKKKNQYWRNLVSEDMNLASAMMDDELVMGDGVVETLTFEPIKNTVQGR